MRDLFKLQFTDRPAREKYKINVIISKFNQVSFGKILKPFGLWP